MRKVAVFGNAGGGKSTLARKLSELTQLPLYSVDMLQYEPGGAKVEHDEYLRAHAELLRRDAWIIDGFGCRKSAWERFASADTLVYVDLPIIRSSISSSRGLALPHPLDAQLPSARRRGRSRQARPSPEIRDGH
jgi:adenylate kinase family enzyme